MCAGEDGVDYVFHISLWCWGKCNKQKTQRWCLFSWLALKGREETKSRPGISFNFHKQMKRNLIGPGHPCCGAQIRDNVDCLCQLDPCPRAQGVLSGREGNSHMGPCHGPSSVANPPRLSSRLCRNISWSHFRSSTDGQEEAEVGRVESRMTCLMRWMLMSQTQEEEISGRSWWTQVLACLVRESEGHVVGHSGSGWKYGLHLRTVRTHDTEATPSGQPSSFGIYALSPLLQCLSETPVKWLQLTFLGIVSPPS